MSNDPVYLDAKRAEISLARAAAVGCRHAAIRAATPGGRCPICSPRTDGLAELERAITPVREVRLEQRVELASRPSDAHVRAQIDALNAEIAEAEHLLGTADAAACRRELGTFARFAWHEVDTSGRPFVENRGTDAIIQHLQALADGVIRLLGVACSPGFGKTSIASVVYPAFMWARDPTWRVICASYAQELSNDIAKRFYRLVTSDWYRRVFPFVVVEGHALKSIATARGGTRYAVGVEGALTGLRADGGVIDDSLNARDHDNKAQIRAANNWFEQSFSTRFDRRSREPTIAVIQQRLADNDMIDLVRRLGGEILELPARFELGRRSSTSIWSDPRTIEGEILAPEIHSEEYLKERERILRARGFATQYQQRPAPREGTQFKVGMWSWATLTGDGTPAPRPDKARTTLARVMPRRPDGSLDLDWVCVSIDASNGSTSSDASNLGLGILGGKDLRTTVLEDRTDGPRTWLGTIRDIATAIVRAGAIAGKQKRFVVLLEKKAMGASEDAALPTQLRSALARGVMEWKDESGTEHKVALKYPDGSPIRAKLELYEPTGKGSKVQRADHLEPDVDAGLVEILDGASWAPDFVEEFALFPGGSADDRVDYVAQCVDHFRVVHDPKERFRKMAR